MIEPAYMLELEFDPRLHLYRWRGELVPNITYVVPSDYSHVNPKVLEIARQRGHAVHKATELYDLGTLNWATLDVKVEPYLVGWTQFKADYEVEFDNYDVERLLYHPIDRYAGTGDRPRMWLRPPGAGQRRRLACSEIKSIAKMDLNVGLQTAGQQRCENYRARALGIEETQERWGIQLRRDPDKHGRHYRAIQYDDKRHERVFLAYLTTIQWELALGKRKLRNAA